MVYGLWCVTVNRDEPVCPQAPACATSRGGRPSPSPNPPPTSTGLYSIKPPRGDSPAPRAEAALRVVHAGEMTAVRPRGGDTCHMSCACLCMGRGRCDPRCKKQRTWIATKATHGSSLTVRGNTGARERSEHERVASGERQAVQRKSRRGVGNAREKRARGGRGEADGVSRKKHPGQAP